MWVRIRVGHNTHGLAKGVTPSSVQLTQTPSFHEAMPGGPVSCGMLLSGGVIICCEYAEMLFSNRLDMFCEALYIRGPYRGPCMQYSLDAVQPRGGVLLSAAAWRKYVLVPDIRWPRDLISQACLPTCIYVQHIHR
jgi:hypothetical protein